MKATETKSIKMTLYECVYYDEYGNTPVCAKAVEKILGSIPPGITIHARISPQRGFRKCKLGLMDCCGRNAKISGKRYFILTATNRTIMSLIHRKTFYFKITEAKG